MTVFVDSHCHLDKLNIESNSLQQQLAFARQRGVTHFLCVAVSVDSFDHMYSLVQHYPDVSVSCGVHPLHQDEACHIDKLREKASLPAVVAVGETGLDYYYSEDTKAIQQSSFIDHIVVANEVEKPLIIHTRNAQTDTIAILKNYKADNTGGVFHCFTEDQTMANHALDLGLYISISGSVTFGSAATLREVVKRVPLERLLIETDSPWLAPVPHRGKPNQPAYVVEVAEYIAQLKGVSVEALAHQTSMNFFNLFSLARCAS